MDPERNGGHDVTRRASGRHGLAGTAVRLRPICWWPAAGTLSQALLD
jgi:hypothetical protein